MQPCTSSSHLSKSIQRCVLLRGGRAPKFFPLAAKPPICPTSAFPCALIDNHRLGLAWLVWAGLVWAGLDCAGLGSDVVCFGVAAV